MEDKYYSRLIKILIFIIDFNLIQIVFSTVRDLGYATGISDVKFTSFILIFSLIWIIASLTNETYRINKFSNLAAIFKNLLTTELLHGLLIASIVLFLEMYRFDPSFFAVLYFLTTALVMSSRIAFKLIWRYVEVAAIAPRNVIIVGTTRSGKALFDFFSSHGPSLYQCKGFFDDSPNYQLVASQLVKGKCGDIQNFCKAENISEIYFTLPQQYEDTIANLSEFADNNFIYLRIVPEFSKAVASNYNVFLLDSVPVFTPRNEPLGISLNAAVKRLFDILFSLLIIIGIFPIAVPIIALAIRMDSKGPIIFKQIRRGKKNTLFECYKFRTMKTDANPSQQAVKNDCRVTRVGKFLRKSSLDELPQFVNVLLGNMSVVGPRPHISKQDEYAKTIVKYPFRYFVTPGITGYAQVNGFRGETSEPVMMEKRVEYDLKYMENWSLSFDLKIILQTIWIMFRGQKNAY
jgi:putative colanic acid biosysnthesis UDP-glucose lipid carrier transferase